jgi:hypothetical protein
MQGIAKTGSGKTAAFVLPMVVHIMDQPELEKGEGPIGIIVAPTRELSEQIHKEARKFSKPYGKPPPALPCPRNSNTRLHMPSLTRRKGAPTCGPVRSLGPL